jgi:D-alanyl-D-alanine carboxypeptidase
VRLASAIRSLRVLFSSKSIAACGLALVIGATATAAPAADSRYAAIVVDANTGKTLFSANAGARRYPASLTKMMTLYLTFEALKTGRIRKSTPVVFSAQAAAQPPTKLGVRAGGSVTVETAIYSLITRSANDSAHALAELLGGSEPAFARLMTAKARALGMESTVFRNPHGLPNTSQFTTARDMATLGIALREHFPQYYSYFSIRNFKYGKQNIANHNRLLGRVKGVDGIKTGYTRASGFNLVSSVSDGRRRIVAVVMGGQSGASRDRQMAKLIAEYLPKASVRGKGPLVARAEGPALSAIAKAILPKPGAPEPESNADDQDREAAEFVARTEMARLAPAPAPALEQAYAAPPPRPPVELDAVETAAVEPSGWVIQVASSPSKAEADATLLATVRRASSVLASSSGYTVPFIKDGVTYHRVRFTGFDTKASAWQACGQLKKKNIGCYAVQN